MIVDLFKVLFGCAPGQLVIQITNHCNGACPQCGMRKNASIARHSLPAEKIRATIDQCARHGFKAVSFTGGEPFINMRALFDLLDYAGKAGISYLRTGTNGFMLAGADMARINDFVARLSVTRVRNFWISLDSADTRTHETMRGLPGVIYGIKTALPVFHAHGLYPAANLGINRNISGKTISRFNGLHDVERFLEAFKAGFAAFFQKAINLGFTMANVCYPMSYDNRDLGNHAYGAISDDFAVSFSREELRLVFRALLETLPEFRNKIRIFTPMSVLYAMSRDDDALLFPCLGGIRYFYIDSRDGHIYPCGYLGDQNLGEGINVVIRQRGRQTPHCMKCHWECFRDPSQLFGIARSVFRSPVSVFLKKELDPVMLKLWFEDLKYYAGNDLFNGRITPGKRLKGIQ